MIFALAATLQLFALGTDADIRTAAAIAAECGVHAEVGRYKTSPALYLQEDVLKDSSSPAVRCFFDKLMASKLSGDFGFVGNDAAPVKPKN
jgi:hypothetical protein